MHFYLNFLIINDIDVLLNIKKIRTTINNTYITIMYYFTCNTLNKY